MTSAGCRLHTDERAAHRANAVHALAYTVGAHVAFASGQYAPSTSEGRRLLARELAHTIQQRGAASWNLDMATNDAAEQEAERAAHAAGSGVNIPVQSRQHATVARQGPGQARFSFHLPRSRRPRRRKGEEEAGRADKQQTRAESRRHMGMGRRRDQESVPHMYRPTPPTRGIQDFC